MIYILNFIIRLLVLWAYVGSADFDFCCDFDLGLAGLYQLVYRSLQLSSVELSLLCCIYFEDVVV